MGANPASQNLPVQHQCPPQKFPGTQSRRHAINWANSSAVVIVHLMSLGVFWVGWSSVAVAAALICFVVRGFGITAFYHRYFSHRAYKASRPAQFVFAVTGACALQGGMLDWAAIHRLHHRKADRTEDIHSPVAHGFWWSHLGWVGCQLPSGFDRHTVADLRKFPELILLERFHALAPILLAAGLLGLGALSGRYVPALHASGAQLLVWGFAISTVALWHVTWSVNSICHMFGRKRFGTGDESRNNALIAVLALGEGWHNNHHRYPGSARQGFYWWEVDVTYYVLLLLRRLGVIWGLRPVPATILKSGRQDARRK